MLQEKRANYLLALVPTPKRAGLAWADLSTGRFFVEDVAREDALDVVARVGPSEILLPEGRIESESGLVSALGRIPGAPAGAVRPVPDWICAESTAARTVKEHFKVGTLQGFGLKRSDPSLGAAAAVILQAFLDSRGE